MLNSNSQLLADNMKWPDKAETRRQLHKYCKHSLE
jgi:hypothetical protein